MSDIRVERRLAAILAADVVGYSRMMGADEAASLKDIVGSVPYGREEDRDRLRMGLELAGL